MPPTHLVIGVDFGTTNWPDPEAHSPTTNKVPTAVVYNIARPEKVLDWGYGAIRRRDGQGSELFEWFKLLLQPESYDENMAGDMLELKNLKDLLHTYGKSAEDVTVDYLKCIWRHTEKQLCMKLGPSFMVEYSVQVVFTIPAIWEPGSRNKVKGLAHKAGLPKNIEFVQEPEAAAMEVLKGSRNIGKGDIITVCDAGGGTCDLQTYEVLTPQPYLKVREFEVGEGGFCGSIFIDKAFETYIESLVGPKQYSAIPGRSKEKMKRNFDWGIKPMFQYNLDENPRLSVDLPGVRDNIPLGIDDGTIRLLSMEQLDKVFRPTCLKVQELVDKQVRKAIERKKTTLVLLVGGFGESSYLFDLLRNSGLGKSSIVKLLQSKKPWTAVCRGATLWGLEHCPSPDDTDKEVMIESRKSQYSYGIIDTPPFDPTKHDEQDKFWDPADAIDRARQIEWIGREIKDGDKFTTEQQRAIRIQFFDFGVRRFHDEVVYCGSDSPPRRRGDSKVKNLGFLPWKVDCKKIRWHERRTGAPFTGRAYFRFRYTLELVLGSTLLEVFAIYRGKRMGMAEMQLGGDGHSVSEYDDDGDTEENEQAPESAVEQTAAPGAEQTAEASGAHYNERIFELPSPTHTNGYARRASVFTTLS
ncbi:hypothetical protein BDD12DRAFT_903507 [Trichophaea hybrida]|nr:hypothetical protein BDD12DRAFT_903507 [Trichophaea hybrida]